MKVIHVCTLDPTDGKQKIIDAGKVFTDGIEEDFRRWNPDPTREPTARLDIATVILPEGAVVGDTIGAAFEYMGNPKDLVLAQSQVVAYCKAFREHMGEGETCSYFLSMHNGEHFVAHVIARRRTSLAVQPYRFRDRPIWPEPGQRRFIVPNQAVAHDPRLIGT